MGIPVLAKGHKNIVLQMGEGQKDVVNTIGEPDIITQDYDNVETWIYTDVKSIPQSGISQNESLENQKQSTLLTIKFDKEYKVKSYGYMTTYFGEKND